MVGNFYWPDWLLKLMGERERKIAFADDTYMTNYDEDCDHDRLPSGQYHIVSTNGRFMCDAHRQEIIS